MEGLSVVAEYQPGPLSVKRDFYVVGFLFTSHREHVVLIKKNRGPNGVVGLWNGVGGKVEEGELSSEAMSREFYEETDVVIGEKMWRHFATLRSPMKTCFVFEFNSGWAERAQTKTDEEVRCFPVQYLPRESNINLSWMVPMALDPTICDVANVQVIA